jgi:hypothetical protein
MGHLRKVAIAEGIIVAMGVPVDGGGCDSEVPNSPPGPTTTGPALRQIGEARAGRASPG